MRPGKCRPPSEHPSKGMAEGAGGQDNNRRCYDADNYSLKVVFNECVAKVPKELFVKDLPLAKAPL